MGCRWVKSSSNALFPLNIKECIVTAYFFYKKRHLNLLVELKFVNFSNSTGEEVERLRCSEANSSLNCSIIFVIKTCISTISVSYHMRGSRLFIEWRITNVSNYTKGDRESLKYRSVN